MKRIRTVFAVALIIALMIPQTVFAAAGQGGRKTAGVNGSRTAEVKQDARFRPGEVIFKARARAFETGILNRYKMNKVRRDEKLGYILASVSAGDVERVVREMQKDKAVEYVQPNRIYRLLGRPSDPQYSRQWAMPRINAEQGWAAAKANSQVTVAILDSGVDVNHPDLKPRLVPGMNTVNPLKSTRDDEGHGTHVAGIVGAVNNNGIGVTGVASPAGIKIMPVKVFSEWGASDISISDGIIWATDHGARVMNMSFGSYYRSEVLADAIDYAYGKGVIMVAAAGNWASEEISYPAALSKVIAVSATDRNNKLADFSSYGPQIDVCAPGDEIYSTFWDPYKGSTYTELSGTSMASPMVTGLAALMLAKNPKLTNDEVRQIIEASSDDLGDKGWDPQFGHGKINVYKALTLSLAKIDDGNSTMKKSVGLTDGTPVKEKINFGSDEDWFKISVPEKSALQVEVLPAGKVSPGVEVYDSAGAVIASFNAPEKQEEEEAEAWFFEGPSRSIKVAEAVYGLVQELDEGDYYIKVFGNHFRWSDEQYTVTARVFAEAEMVNDPSEPNDSYEEAKTIQVGSEVTGAILDEEDEDWYKVSLSGGAYKLSVDVPEGLDIAVDIESAFNYQETSDDLDWEYYDAHWYSETVNNAGQGKDEEGIIVLPSGGAGDYYLKLYDSAGGSGVNENYSFRLTPFQFRADKYEGNDSAGSAKLVNLGEEISANFHNEEDEDWYVIDVQNTGILKVNLKQPPGTWCSLQLLDDPEGNPINGDYFDYRYGLGSDYFDFYGDDDTDREKAFEFKVTRKKYYLRVYNYGDLSAEDYTIKTEFSPFDYVDFEVNDTPLRANGIKPGEIKKGTLYPDGDIDFYVVEVEKPQPYLVYLTPPKDLNTQIAVFKEAEPEDKQGKGGSGEGDEEEADGSGGKYPPGYEEEPSGPPEPDLDPLTMIDSGEKGQPDTGVFVANKPGRYYILLGAVTEKVDGKELAKSEGLYSLSVKPFKAQPDAWENNNTMAKARAIAAGTAIKPTFMGTEDQDWYKVGVPGKGSLAVSMAVPSDIDGVLEIYDSSGKLAVRIDQSMVGEEEAGSVAISKQGYYYIKAYDYMGNSSVQQYTLSVKFNPSAVKRK